MGIFRSSATLDGGIGRECTRIFSRRAGQHGSALALPEVATAPPTKLGPPEEGVYLLRMPVAQEGFLTASDLGLDKDSLKRSIAHHIEYTRVADERTATMLDFYWAVARVVRDRMVDLWNKRQHQPEQVRERRVYYLSLEFLLGRLLENNLLNLQLYEPMAEALGELGYDIADILRQEDDAGLGNGGLGRLAACFLDSMATLGIAGTGYGIRYEYGIFRQEISDGAQVERADNWLRYGNPWEVEKPSPIFGVRFGGSVKRAISSSGRTHFEWESSDLVMAMAHDIFIPGYQNGIVNRLRLWSAKATREFSFADFNRGDYLQSLYDKNATENISRVLYPNDMVDQGRELRFKQEYFLVSATLQDVIARHLAEFENLENLHEKAIFQLNDTHPVIAIAELLRILLDEHHLGWEAAYFIVTGTFAYTNHTVMPEALEHWEVGLVERLLPRHQMLIYEINRRFLQEVSSRYPGDTERLRRMSLIDEASPRRVRMAHLALVASSAVNGVSKLHTQIITQRLFRDFAEWSPEKFNNKTNGITPRRWLLGANPKLSQLISAHIGKEWVTDLEELSRLAPLARNSDFQAAWQRVKRGNKELLTRHLRSLTGTTLDPESMFDVQVKRLHEYKRQLLNILQVVAHYHDILRGRPSGPPRTFLFAGKAAPGYIAAKLIIELITGVARTIELDPKVSALLRVVFVPDYNVSLAEKLVVAADVSEQISLAGTEASGTSNMKFALNGALTLGTLDGANIEILEAVGHENMFIFGLTAHEVEARRQQGYRPEDIWHTDAELTEVLDAIETGAFSRGDREKFRPLVRDLRTQDPYFVCADFRSYRECQKRVGEAYADQDRWVTQSIMNSAHMGPFSSDRVIAEYARDIWRVGDGTRRRAT
ncbi:MAG: glycogen/starch/alpha-glucan phosphorylase [Polyangiaceae bacterium]|nr:glycogen/starch/alpha-glucan phosphorylase [Polyangiaceae bacterium]